MSKYNNSISKFTVSEDVRALILSNLDLVRYVVGKMGIYFSKEDEEDVIGHGILGLIEAAKRFDPAKGVKFNTFAVHRIKGSIIDYLRARDWLPRSLRKKESDIKETQESMRKRLRREPTEEELVNEAGISIEELHKIQAKVSFDYFLSIDSMSFEGEDGDEGDFHNILEDKNTREAWSIMEDKEEKELMLSLIQELPRMERLVITLYYYEDMLLKEIGKVLNISESRVSQLHHKALFFLKTNMQKVHGCADSRD